MKILWSRAGRGGEDALLAGLLEKAALGEQCVWIVPEPYSHAAERLLAEKGGAPVCLTAEVLTFRRMCDNILSLGGGLASPVLDAGGRLLVMRRAAALAAGELKTLNVMAAKPGFLPGLIQTLDECKCYGITPQMLEQAGGDKLKDLALIFSMYEMLCEQSSRDPLDRVVLAWKKAKEIRFCKDAHIFISYFISFTPQERLLLKTLERNAASFTVLLKGELNEPGFEPLHITAKQLLRTNNNEQVTINNAETERNPALAHMERYWFERKPPLFQDNADGAVGLYSAPGEAAEVRLAAELTVGLARDEGMRWREIAIIASDYQAYAPLIESIFPIYGIPVFSDRMDEVADKPLLRCIRCAADCLRYGYRPGDVMGLLRCGLLPIPPSAADLFEDYLRRWNPRKGRFAGKADWTRPLGGWHGEPEEKDVEELAGINAVRRHITGALKHLSGGKTAKMCAQALLRTMEELRVPEGIAERAAALNKAGEAKSANECGQMWEIFLKGLEQCAAFLQDESMEIQEFCELCLLVLSGYSVGSIPASLDRVHAGDQGRYPRLPFKAVIYIGASDEKVPARPGGEGLLGTRRAGRRRVRDAARPARAD
jgi:ATP-dependent helicase/nuclease subunit B